MGYNKGRIRKIGLLLVVCLGLSIGSTRAQSMAQLIEQLILDMQKLTELKTILKDMQEGYQVIDKGYTNIRDIVQGNFNLHKAFLDGLLAVSPSVRQYYKVAAIMDKERRIVTEYRAAGRRWVSSGLFTTSELGYIGRVYGVLSDRSTQCLDRLEMVMTADKLRMSDAERIEAIDRIDEDVTGQLEGLRRFNDGLTVQALQRAREINSINILKNMYGIHP